ncbi:MAG: Gp49 family protein [Hyphomonas sp.]
MNSLKASDDLAASVQKSPNRVTLAEIEATVAHVEYVNPACQPHLTICVLLLQNGFSVIGKSAPADPDNFDNEAGRKFARQDALRQIWPLEGYLLRSRLAHQ